MKSRQENLLELLHGCRDGALATHSLAMPGFPFATALPFATDERHRPIMLISRLAEHTQNLAADPRASLLVCRPLADGEMVRATVVGHVGPVADADPPLVARYLRYQPEAARLLQFGDFRLFCLEPLRTRIIGGFAQAGWLDGDRLVDGPVLPLGDEANVLAALRPLLPMGTEVLGVDCHGIDLLSGAERRRAAFADVSSTVADVFAAARSIVDALGD
jgi:heme iron utilization protein